MPQRLHQASHRKIRGFVDPLVFAQAVRDEPEPSLAAELRVEELERAGRGVARIGERELLGGAAQLVEPDQLGVGHVDLASDLEQGRGAVLEDQGDLTDGLQIRRDVVAALAVAAGRPLTRTHCSYRSETATPSTLSSTT